MSELQADLRAAFEDEGYDVDDVTVNRDQVRIVLLAEGESASDLEAITYGVVDEDDVLTMNVTTEQVDGQGMSTVVTFRHRG
ncbi:hypothetical protein SAMN05216388_102110 [Halorientalis persicus]|jgi:hypothetical protein|uniref:Uncharacterized protein n=1 Tax=Halorientalis persicus TaxID=1367881 RepID=A0A1H8T440_9EURY|nr:hypothetical protein [Halorientalis persicus]SEO85313.1 hypothetical protein SAMN05216388_102110 [Halorientalis persicus]